MLCREINVEIDDSRLEILFEIEDSRDKLLGIATIVEVSIWRKSQGHRGF